MAAPDSWGNGNWGQLRWGQNNSVTVGVSGLSVTSSLGSISVTAQLNAGWGRKTWGNLAWGAAFTTAPAGLQTTISLGTALAKAGAKASPSTNLISSGVGLVDIQTDAANINVSLPAITTSVGSPRVSDDETVSLTGIAITSSLGAAGVVSGADADATCQQINTSLDQLDLP